MSNVNAQASSSRRPATTARSQGGKGKGRPTPTAGKTKVKSNQAKRQQADDELKELQARIDGFVSRLLCLESCYSLKFQIVTVQLDRDLLAITSVSSDLERCVGYGLDFGWCAPTDGGAKV